MTALAPTYPSNHWTPERFDALVTAEVEQEVRIEAAYDRPICKETIRRIRTDLSEWMHGLADKGHPRAVELREKADAFDVATHGFTAIHPPTHTVKQMLGSWARARRAYCECSGKPLLP